MWGARGLWGVDSRLRAGVAGDMAVPPHTPSPTSAAQQHPSPPHADVFPSLGTVTCAYKVCSAEHKASDTLGGSLLPMGVWGDILSLPVLGAAHVLPQRQLEGGPASQTSNPLTKPPFDSHFHLPCSFSSLSPSCLLESPSKYNYPGPQGLPQGLLLGKPILRCAFKS